MSRNSKKKKEVVYLVCFSLLKAECFQEELLFTIVIACEQNIYNQPRLIIHRIETIVIGMFTFSSLLFNTKYCRGFISVLHEM